MSRGVKIREIYTTESTPEIPIPTNLEIPIANLETDSHILAAPISKFLTLWTPEDGIPTFRKCPNAAKLRYTVQTASYKPRRPTVYHRYGS